MLAAIVLAAGSAGRAGEDKALADLGGRPLFLWSALRLAAEPRVQALIVVARPDAIRAVEDAAHEARKLVAVVPGGTARADSARAGIAAAREAGALLVHDAARPFLDAATLSRVLDALERHGSAAAALPEVDTLRRARDEEGGWAGDTLERRRLWRMQTPQAFPRDVLAAAYARPGVQTGDCAEAVLTAGGKVRLVRGDPLNFKVTDAADLALARRLAEAGVARPALALEVGRP